jgi:hypothetical protein
VEHRTQLLKYNGDKELLYITVDKHTDQVFSVFADVAIIGIYDPYNVSFEDDYLKINGMVDGFFACKNIPYDPNHLSKNYFALMHLLDDTAPEGCKPVKVKRNII